MADEPWAHSRYDSATGAVPGRSGDRLPSTIPGATSDGSTPMRPGPPSTALASGSTVFMSGCLLRCLYCHNPDTWHLKDGTRVSFERAKTALQAYAAPLRAMDGGIDDFRRGAAGPTAFHQAALRSRQGHGVSTRRWTHRASSEHAPTTSICVMSISYCSTSNPGTRKPIAEPSVRTYARPFNSRSAWQLSANRSGCGSCWSRA